MSAVTLSETNTRSRPASQAVGFAVLAIALCFGAAAVGSAATLPRIPGWYASIEKPWFTPPNAVFGPVWTVLFAVMAFVLWKILVARPSPERRAAIAVFVVQLVLNAGWSVAFFGFASPLAGLIVILPLWASIVWTMAAARPVIGRLAFLLVPYLLWVSYATALNIGIFALNG